jgi:PncC family amidohydrolase
MGQGRILAERVVKSLCVQKKTIAAAESCTAGLAADFIARIPGASDVFWGSFVVYTVDAKVKMLGISEELIEKHGAVSQAVALAMAEEALNKSGASWAFSITGLAGPGGDGTLTPLGTVWIGTACRDRESSGFMRSEAKNFLFSGSRNEVREAAAAAALEEILELINGNHQKKSKNENCRN